MPSPRPTPVFVSDEEALAAATDAYTKYVTVSDLISRDGGVEPERIKTVVTPTWAAKEIRSFERLEMSGNKQVGRSNFDSLRIQKFEIVASGSTRVTSYLCADVSATDVVDTNGRSVISPNRITRVAMQVTFINLAEGNHQLFIDGSEPWSGANFC